LIRFCLIIFLTCYNSLCFADEVKFKVAVVIPLSGALAEYGVAIRNGFELAKLENDEDYAQIDFRYEDSGYDGKTAASALQRLISKDTMDLYYLWGVSPTEAMLPIAHREKLAVIAETTIKESTVGKELVVRAARTGERIAQALANELEKRNIKTVSLMLTEIPFYVDIVKHLKLILEHKGIEVINFVEVLPSAYDFKTYLTILKKADAEENFAIGAMLLPGQLIAFYRQMAELKMKNPTFNSDILDSSNIIKACPDTVNEAFFTQVGVTNEFRTKYISTFKDDFHIGSAAQAYDIAVLVRDLFGKMDRKLASEDIIGKISSIPPRQGATGKFAFTSSTENGKELRMPVSMKTVRNRQIMVITDDTGD
jgi:branched-chain amino acid transport system substrate-binding protein